MKTVELMNKKYINLMKNIVLRKYRMTIFEHEEEFEDFFQDYLLNILRYPTEFSSNNEEEIKRYINSSCNMFIKDKYKEIKRDKRKANQKATMIYIDSNNNENYDYFIDKISYNYYIDNLNNDKLSSLFESLTEEEKQLTLYKFRDGLTSELIARELNLTKRQIDYKMKKLKDKIKKIA